MLIRKILKGATKIAIEKGAQHLQESKVNAVAKSLNSDTSNLNVGDILRIDSSRFALVVSQKSETTKGLLASLKLDKDKWHFENSYCPYLREVAYNGRCDLITDATSRTDGLANQTCVLTLSDKLDAETERKRNTYTCPPNEYYFPAFNLCKRYGDGWYLPAIEELGMLFNDGKLASKWFSFINKLNNADFNEAEKIYFWSSTDNGNRKTSDSNYSEALAWEISLNNKSSIASRIKSEDAFILPFYRF